MNKTNQERKAYRKVINKIENELIRTSNVFPCLSQEKVLQVEGNASDFFVVSAAHRENVLCSRKWLNYFHCREKACVREGRLLVRGRKTLRSEEKEVAGDEI